MDRLTDALEKVKSQMTNPEEETMAIAKKKVPTKRVKATEDTKPQLTKVAADTKKKSTKPPVDSDLVTLKDICTELKIEPALARRYLRSDKIDNPGRWAWKDGSSELKKARECLTRE